MAPRTLISGTPPGLLATAIATALFAAWLPLPFASVTPLSVFLFRLLTAVLLVAAIAFVPLTPRRNSVAGPAAALVLLACLGLLQAHVGSARIVRHDHPESGTPAPVNEAGLISFPFWRPVSVSPWASREAAVNWGAAAGLLLLGGWLGRRRISRRLTGGALLASGAFQVLYGVPRWRGESNEIWGLAVAGSARLRGTFVNPNHLACFLGLVLPLLFAWGWWAVRRAGDEEVWERKLLLAAPPALTWLVLFVALAFTGSRGGLAAAVAAAAAQGVLLATRRRRSSLAPLTALLPAFALGAVAVVGLEQGLGRWLATSPHELTWNARTEVYAATVDLWRKAPLFGTGLGTFADTFPLVEPAASGVAFDHAHNDYLELLATTGVAGAAAVAAGIILLTLRLLRVFRSGNRREDRAAALGALGVLVALATHSLVEFGLSIPAISGSAALIAGLAAGAPTTGTSV